MTDKEQKKILGEERRQLILSWLMTAEKPLSGSEISKRTHVSRQIIVQDISLLKARNEPIIATAQGYVYMRPTSPQQTYERIIACKHSPEEVRTELTLLVDHGVTVKDVKVEHPVYGDLTAPIMVSTRYELDQYLSRIEETKAAYLSQLTDGVHLHTLMANCPSKLDAACNALKQTGILIS